LIVFLLREITKAFGNTWARVSDGDGEFLLIEAAAQTPSWLNPNIDANRVWLHQGKLHIIPPRAGSGSSITLPQALAVIRSAPESLVHNSTLEAEAFYRLEKYPGYISSSIHRALVIIPRKLAYVLHERPEAIAPAIESLALLDPTSIKPLIGGSTRRLPPVDLVKVSVRFTKLLFAQVRCQQLPVPPAWAAELMAAGAGAGARPDADKQLGMLELGMKITCGFETMTTKAETSNNRVVREVRLILDDLAEDGDATLPSNKQMEAWKDIDREDDESWMDIDFLDFQRELEGRQGNHRGAREHDATATADLRKIVSRFEAFLNDESAGLDGVDIDARHDSESEDEDSSEVVAEANEEDGENEEGEEIAFSEEEFTRLMLNLVRQPSDQAALAVDMPGQGQDGGSNEDTTEGIGELAAQMEAELKGHGALKLSHGLRTLSGEKDSLEAGTSSDADESEGDGVDVDYNLARNLLASVKGQAGLAGPAGNILGMMGLSLPRDEDDRQQRTT